MTVRTYPASPGVGKELLMTAVGDRSMTEGTPFPGSRKTYLHSSRPDPRVPMREVLLSTGDSAVLYVPLHRSKVHDGPAVA